VSALLADTVLALHVLFVAFVVGGLLCIWTGIALGWRWVSNYSFRLAHLAAICFVAAEALLGMMCPLTVWEDALRGSRDDLSFVARWLRRVIYYNFPEWVFTTAYVLFALAVIATYWVAPPAGRRRDRP
jgi:hypothetical protein